MRKTLLLALALTSAICAAAAEPSAGKRLTGLEKRVSKVEKRVTALEEGAVGDPEAAAVPVQPAKPKDPIAVYFIKKKQYVSGDKMGVAITLEFENMTAKKYFAFDGELVFTNETGEIIWRHPYGYSEPFSGGLRREAIIRVSSLQAKPYLKFVKALSVSVKLEKLAVYGE